MEAAQNNHHLSFTIESPYGDIKAEQVPKGPGVLGAFGSQIPHSEHPNPNRPTTQMQEGSDALTKVLSCALLYYNILRLKLYSRLLFCSPFLSLFYHNFIKNHKINNLLKKDFPIV